MEARIPMIAANWKMYKTIGESISFVAQLQSELGPMQDREVVIAPSFTALQAVRQVMSVPGFKLAAQNCHWEEKGAFTGEISTGMIQDAGCRYVIVGHSERRHVFGETDEETAKKVRAVLDHGLIPILCVGEKLDQREAGKTFEVVSSQMAAAAAVLDKEESGKLVLAYEPVWAIGTGKTATPDQAQDVHLFIRDNCASLFDKEVAKGLRILYGGSVKPDNVDALMSQKDIDGMLVGGASLEVASFKRIVQFQTQGK